MWGRPGLPSRTLQPEWELPAPRPRGTPLSCGVSASTARSEPANGLTDSPQLSAASSQASHSPTRATAGRMLRSTQSLGDPGPFLSTPPRRLPRGPLCTVGKGRERGSRRMPAGLGVVDPFRLLSPGHQSGARSVVVGGHGKCMSSSQNILSTPSMPLSVSTNRSQQGRARPSQGCAPGLAQESCAIRRCESP